jgi:phosphatidylglycerol:prolipoprotein diacylglycerol transferase
MSFHGGALGVILALFFFARRYKLDWVAFADRVVCVVPIGLFLGRLANFINGELWGRVAEVPWAMVFPGAGPDPRHPSQLYQAGLEGVCLFILLMVLVSRPSIRARVGVLSGVFLAGYGVARFTGEFFRQPDAHLGFLFAGATMGQLLSLPMMLVGAWLIARGWRIGASKAS